MTLARERLRARKAPGWRRACAAGLAALSCACMRAALPPPPAPEAVVPAGAPMFAVAMTVAAPVGSDESSLLLPVAMGVASVGLALVVVGLLMIASDPVVDQEGAGTRLAAPAELLAPPAGAGAR